MSDDSLMTREESANYLHLKKSTLDSWATRGCGPAFVRLSRKCVRYRRADLDRWLAEREVVTTSAA